MQLCIKTPKQKDGRGVPEAVTNIVLEIMENCQTEKYTWQNLEHEPRCLLECLKAKGQSMFSWRQPFYNCVISTFQKHCFGLAGICGGNLAFVGFIVT